MLSKNIIKFIKSLQLKKFRDEQGLFIVEGRKSVLELIQSDFEIETIFSTQDYLHELSQFDKSTFKISEVKKEELESMSRVDSNNTMLAVAKIKQQQLISYRNLTKILILDQIQDPGNLGTLIRTADWFGIDAILCSTNSADFYSPKVITATMGSFTRVKIHYCNLETEISLLKKEGFAMYGALLNGEKLNSLKIPEKWAMIIGNESNGISLGIQKMIDKAVKIEGFGKAESLNASVAAGILMHQFSMIGK